MGAEPKQVKTWFTIREAADVSGLSPSVLRIWELRYGWPNPHRNAGNDYRRYSDVLVRDLKRAKVLHKAGISPSVFIENRAFVDQVLKHEKKPVVGQPRLGALRDYISLVDSSRGQAVFADMKRTLLGGQHAEAVALLHAWATVHPFDRYKALWMPAALWVVGIEGVAGFEVPLDAVWKALTASAQHRYDDVIAEAKKMVDGDTDVPAAPAAAVPAPRAPEPQPATPPAPPAAEVRDEPVDADAGVASGGVAEADAPAVRVPDDGELAPATAAIDAGAEELPVQRDHGGEHLVDDGAAEAVVPSEPGPEQRGAEPAGEQGEEAEVVRPAEGPAPRREIRSSLQTEPRPWPNAKYVIEGGKLTWV